MTRFKNDAITQASLGPNMDKRANTNILAHTCTGIDHGRRVNTWGRDIFLGCKQFEGPPQWCVLDQNQSLAFCITVGLQILLSKHHGSRGRGFGHREPCGFPKPQPHHPKWHARSRRPHNLPRRIAKNLSMQACGEFLSSGGTAQSSFIRLVTIMVTSATGSAWRTD